MTLVLASTTSQSLKIPKISLWGVCNVAKMLLANIVTILSIDPGVMQAWVQVTRQVSILSSLLFCQNWSFSCLTFFVPVRPIYFPPQKKVKSTFTCLSCIEIPSRPCCILCLHSQSKPLPGLSLGISNKFTYSLLEDEEKIAKAVHKLKTKKHLQKYITSYSVLQHGLVVTESVTILPVKLFWNAKVDLIFFFTNVKLALLHAGNGLIFLQM